MFRGGYIFIYLIRGYIFNWVGVNEKKKKEEKKQGINVSKTECGRGATVEGDGEGGGGSACFGWVWAWVLLFLYKKCQGPFFQGLAVVLFHPNIDSCTNGCGAWLQSTDV